MEGSPTIVKNYVNVGSMNETDDIKGISHFLEHMAFNGTTGENGYIKLDTGDSFKKIDRLGGWTNASTNYALTDYVNSTPLLEDKDLEEQIKILAAMTEDLALTPEMIEKEKGPVCSEINMILDNPQTILIDQTVRTLFNIKSSADELVAGSTKHIENLTKTNGTKLIFSNLKQLNKWLKEIGCE
jgi:predicted Zn-dependent peptidase